MFDMKRPCPGCPFRTDIAPYLARRRAAEIARALLDDQSFHCHKTVDYRGEDGEGQVTGDSQHCAGATIVLEKMGQPNQMMRISERLRMYDRRRLDMKAPVVEDLEEFVERQPVRVVRVALAKAEGSEE